MMEKPSSNVHHILFNRRRFTNLGGVALTIRNHRLLTPTIDYDVHTELHKRTATLARSWKSGLFTPELHSSFTKQTDTLGAMDAVLGYFETLSRTGRVSNTLRCEAERMCSFIEVQRAFVVDGIIEVE